MDKYQKEQIRSLRKEGLSYAEIARQVEACRDAVISFCRRNGVQEIKKKAPAPAISAGDVCRKCGKPLIQVDGMKRRVFCSKECRIKWWKEHPEQQNLRLCTSTPVHIADGLLPTVIPSVNTAPMLCFSPIDSEVERMSEAEFHAEKMYLLCLGTAKTMLEKGVISEEEFTKIDTMLLEKYKGLCLHYCWENP